MTRSSSFRARPGTANGDDYSPSSTPSDASAGDSLDVIRAYVLVDQAGRVALAVERA